MKVLVAGDFCDKLRVSQRIKEGNYAEFFSGVRDIINSVDYSIVNFEFPIVQTKGMPIPKCGPNLKGQRQSVEAVKYAGFKCCTLANNHILDQGEQCALDTKQFIEEAGIDTVGLGENKQIAKRILYKEIAGDTLAIINCCEHESSVATDSSVGANALDPVHQYYSIQEARKKADYVLVIVHGGHELFQLPSHRMKEAYRFFIDAGADAVVNHHQHCYSGYEEYNGKPIFYGIGNFFFDRRETQNKPWNYGYMVALDFSNGKVAYELYPYSQCNPKVSVELLNESDSNDFRQKIMALNDVISDDFKLSVAIKDYYGRRASDELYLLEPYEGKVLQKLFLCGFLPSFVKRKVNVILNHLECESHRDKMLYALKKKRDEI